MSEPTPDPPAAVPPLPSPPPPPSPLPPPSPHPSPGPRHAVATEPEPRRHPRRWFLAGAGLTVLAAGGGIGAAYAWPERRPAPSAPPSQLSAAIAAERTLIADLDATTGGTADVRRVLVQARSDHAAHLQALTALASGFATRPAAAVAGQPRTVAYLRAAEHRAASDSAARAAGLDADAAQLATVLASIAACEATHAELLT